jgi:hypothetical protein
MSGVIGKMIEHLSDEFGRVFVPCVTGNHGRTSRKPRAKRRNHTNVDWLLYNMLALQFAKDKRVAFQMMPREDWEFFVVGADGTTDARVTREIQHDVQPMFLTGTAWSVPSRAAASPIALSTIRRRRASASSTTTSAIAPSIRKPGLVGSPANKPLVGRTRRRHGVGRAGRVSGRLVVP